VNERAAGHRRTEWAVEFVSRYDRGHAHVLRKIDEASARLHASNTGAVLLARTVEVGDWVEVSDD
jgi:hypothetical protein